MSSKSAVGTLLETLLDFFPVEIDNEVDIGIYRHLQDLDFGICAGRNSLQYYPSGIEIRKLASWIEG